MVGAATRYNGMVCAAPLLLDAVPQVIVFIASKSGEGTTTAAHEFLEHSLGRGVVLTLCPAAQMAEVRAFGLSRSAPIPMDPLLPWRVEAHPTSAARSKDCLCVLALDGVLDPGFWRALRSLDVSVVVDAPALETSSLGLAAARNADTTLLVVAAEDTRYHVALHGRDMLIAAGAKIAGVVLNKRHYYIPDQVYRGL